MNKIKTNLKIYTLITTSIIGVVLLLIYFNVLPRVIEVIREISETQVEKMKGRIFLIMVGYFIFALIINFLVWRIENKTEKEETEIQNLLKINPRDLSLQKKLKRIEKRKQFYLSLICPALMIVIGLTTSFIAITIIKPLYNLIGAF